MAKAKTTISKVKQRTEVVDLKTLKIQAFDSDNIYPQRTEDIANDSGTTKACIALRSKYSAGLSFTDTNLGSVTLNRKGLTADKLRKKIADSNSHHGGTVIHFNFNGLGEKTEINFIPFPFGRLTLEKSDVPDRVAIYDNWDSKSGKFKKEDINYIHKYDRFKVLEQVESEELKNFKGDEMEELEAKFDKYQGQVYYWTPEGSDKYPLCPFDAVLEDCITEANTKRFKCSTSSRNFMPSHVVVTGRDEVEEDNDGKPIDSNEPGIGELFQQFQGSEEAGQLVLVQKDHNDEPFEIIPVEIQDYDAKLSHTEDSSTEDIVRNFNIPDILLLRREGGLGGNGAELYEARTYLNETTQTERDNISEIIEECFKGFVGNTGFTDFGIEPLKFKKPISADSYQYYSKNEVRKDQGHEEVTDSEGDTQILAVTLGVGGTQSLTGIISDPLLTPEQKKGTIQVLFGIPEVEINKMLGI